MPAEVDATDAGRLQVGPLARAAVTYASADGAKSDLLAEGDVRRAADDRRLLRLAQVDRNEAQAVGVRVRLHGGDGADADAVPLFAATDDAPNLDAGECQAVGQCPRRQGERDIVREPFQRYEHRASGPRAGI